MNLMLMNISSFFKSGAAALLLSSGLASATGMVPETSVVIVDQGDGEGAINIKNTDAFPVMLLTTLENIPEDKEHLLTITPPAARVEPGKNQRVRFMFTSATPLRTERLERVVFEGIPPQLKDKNEVRFTVRQNLPVLIRPAGLPADASPWKHLTWKKQGDALVVSNNSPYVVRLAQEVETRPDNIMWKLPGSYVLPGQTLTLTTVNGKKPGVAKQVHISPATTWGYAVNTYDAPLAS
ncbi:fimbria/pilus chaperone family protein [Serratia marcescens]|uniref:fimbria/pilus chaperone family protein n=1 Tax=Serratia marcescens TaxID=615 RepID=UPI0002B8A270|nr:fimbria/pilus chaperone family protein [Serratia marcescens]EMF07028.1 fimbrial chaperone protein [Serratia marcescens VGH107]